MQYFLTLFVNAKKRRKMNKNNAKDKYSNFEALVDKKTLFLFLHFYEILTKLAKFSKVKRSQV